MTRLVTFSAQRGAAINFPSGQQQPTAIFEFDDTYPAETQVRVHGTKSPATGELMANCGNTLVSLGTAASFDETIDLQDEGDHIKIISEDFIGQVLTLSVDIV